MTPVDRDTGPDDEPIDRHSVNLGLRLDTYLGAVAHELRVQGVLTGSPQRTEPANRLMGSIVIDCTTLRVAAWTPDVGRPAAGQSLGGAVHPDRPAPVVAIWDEREGWCVGLHHDPANASRRYLHPELLPAAGLVAEFVVGLALGRVLGAAQPLRLSAAGRPQLRLIR